MTYFIKLIVYIIACFAMGWTSGYVLADNTASKEWIICITVQYMALTYLYFN